MRRLEKLTVVQVELERGFSPLRGGVAARFFLLRGGVGARFLPSEVELERGFSEADFRSYSHKVNQNRDL
jgi:hypothetical protein